MRINQNIAALNTYRSLTNNTTMGAKSLEKLSSGLRINRAGDDAAGLAISEKMRGQIRGLDQASRNAQDGISLIQTAEGALNETHSILQRMRELAVQASADSNTDTDRKELQKEVSQLIKEIDRISNTTEFNSQKLLDGTKANVVAKSHSAELLASNTNEYTVSGISTIAADKTYLFKVGNETTTTGTFNYTITDEAGSNIATGTIANTATSLTVATGVELTFASGSISSGDSVAIVARKTVTADADKSFALQIGANSTQTISVDVSDMSAKALRVDTVKIDTQKGAEASISAVEQALRDVSAERSKLGAFQNRLEHTINNLGTSSENLSAAESRIRDVDMAKEMMEFTKTNILSQAAQAMLAQANQQPQGVLQLLR
ncbi:MAG: flagellin [Bacillota bacterium]